MNWTMTGMAVYVIGITLLMVRQYFASKDAQSAFAEYKNLTDRHDVEKMQLMVDYLRCHRVVRNRVIRVKVMYQTIPGVEADRDKWLVAELDKLEQFVYDVIVGDPKRAVLQRLSMVPFGSLNVPDAKNE